MSKELEALGRIKEFYPQWRLSNRNDFELIEKTLKRLEQYDSILKKYGCVSGDLNYFLARIFTKLEQTGIALDKFKKEFDLLKEVLQ